jgi:di/tricarboxylate transporter
MSQASLMLVILAVTVVAFVFAKWNFWITALLAEIVLMLTQILTPIEAFSGFSDKNVVLIVCMMIIGAGIGKTSIVYTVKEFLAKQNGNERKLVFVILLAVALVAQFLSPATTLGVILPIIMAIGDDSKGLTASRIVYPIMAVAHYFASIVPVGIGATVPLQDNAMMLSMGVTAEFKVTDIFFNCIWGAVAMLIYFVFAYKTLPQKPRYGTDISSAVKEVKKSDLNPVQEKMALPHFCVDIPGADPRQPYELVVDLSCRSHRCRRDGFDRSTERKGIFLLHSVAHGLFDGFHPPAGRCHAEDRSGRACREPAGKPSL